MKIQKQTPIPAPKRINKIPQFIGEELLVNIIKTILIECNSYALINNHNNDPVIVHDAQLSLLEISQYIGDALSDYRNEILAYIADNRRSTRYNDMLHDIAYLIYDEKTNNNKK